MRSSPTSGIKSKTISKRPKRGKEAPDDQKGVYWRSTTIDIDSRLWVSRGIAKTETEASEEVFQMLRQS
jgi:hypothetical protein